MQTILLEYVKLIIITFFFFFRGLQVFCFCSGKEKPFEQGKKLERRFVGLLSEKMRRLKVVLATHRRACFLPALHTTVLPSAGSAASLASKSLKMAKYAAVL